MKTVKVENGFLIIKFFTRDQVEWNRLLNVVRSLDKRYFIKNQRLWKAVSTQKNVQKLKKNGFEFEEKIIEEIEKEEINLENIKKEIDKIRYDSKVLYDYQIQHTKNLIYVFKNQNGVLDASDLGTGKTFCALALAKHLNLFPVIVCPKSVKYGWIEVSKVFGIEIYVNNYEQYRLKKTPYFKDEWDLDNKHLLIFDECHRLKDSKTLTSQMALKALGKCKILGLSGTIADNPLQMYVMGQILGLFTIIKYKNGKMNNNEFWDWAHNCGVRDGHFGKEFNPNKKDRIKYLQKIHEDIFPYRGARIRKSELGDKFPENQIIADCYNMQDEQKIQNIYNTMKKELSELRRKEEKDKSSELVVILRARQEVELLKVPTFVELAKNYIDEGMSVVIFVNFKETVKALKTHLKTNCLITGSVKDQERADNIENFQADKERIIICNIRAGGVGISLHDLNGNHPRVSLISPTYSSQDLAQAFGRIHRAGAKSKAVQKIIFCANTIEEKIAKAVKKKIHNINIINDGDLNIENF